MGQHSDIAALLETGPRLETQGQSVIWTSLGLDFTAAFATM